MAFETLTPLISYPADGVITEFDIPDKFYEASDVKVFYVNEDGEESQYDFGTDYSVIITAIDPTPPARKSGKVVFVTPPADEGDVVVFIWPDVDQDQPFEGQPVTPRQNERVHDRHAMRDAAAREFLQRGFRAPLNTAPALRFIAIGAPGSVPMFDGLGNLIVGPTAGAIADAEANAIAAAASAAAAAAQAAAAAASAANAAASAVSAAASATDANTSKLAAAASATAAATSATNAATSASAAAASATTASTAATNAAASASAAAASATAAGTSASNAAASAAAASASAATASSAQAAASASAAAAAASAAAAAASAALFTDGDKGDIILSGAGTVWNLDAKVVTDAKVADALANRLSYAATTKSEMRAVDTTRYQVIVLRHSSLPGCDGVFVWRTGDYTSQVATDNWEGVFVKATAIAASVGCWVRLDARHDRASGIFQSALNAAWFGAVGTSYGDSVGSFTSADAQIQCAINLLPAGIGGTIYIPAGYYYLSATLAWANKPVRIYGDGKDQTQLLMNGTNVSGIYITHTGSLARLSRQYSVQLDDFSIVRKTGSGGVGVRVKWPESTDNTARFMARNFAVYNENDGGAYFDFGIELVNCSGSRIENVSIKGNPNANSNWATDAPWGMQIGIWMHTDGGNTTGHINHFWNGLTIGEANTCLKIEGWYEGFYMTNFEFVHCKQGIGVFGYATTKNPVFYVANGHIECRKEIVYLDNVNGPQFVNIAGYRYRNMAAVASALWTFVSCERIKLIGAGAQDAGINNAGLRGFRFVGCSWLTMQGCSVENAVSSCIEISGLLHGTIGGMVNRNSNYNFELSGTNSNVKVANTNVNDNVTAVSTGSTSGITFL